MLFAVREPTEDRHLRGLPELMLPGLADDDARALLVAAIPGRSMPASEIESSLKLGEILWRCWNCPKGMTAAELAGGFAALTRGIFRVSRRSTFLGVSMRCPKPPSD